MQRALVCAAALLLGAAPAAQSYWTAPPGYENRATDWWSGFLGQFVEGRMQLLDSSVNSLAATMLRVEYRTAAHVNYSAFNGMGRTWSNTRITIGPCANRQATTDFSKNYKATGTRVYTGKTTLPSLTGTRKQVWGNTLSVGFAKPYVKKKGDDLLLDFETYGGALHNGHVPRSGVAEYFMDGTRVGNSSSDLGTDVPPRSTCNDSAQTHSNGALVYSFVYNYGSLHPNTNLRDRLFVSYSTLYTAPKQAPVILAASVGGSDAGVAAPAFGCNKLHINTGLILGVITGKTTTSLAGHFSGSLTVPFQEAWTAAPIYLQAAWTDSKTGRPMLTRARKWRVPAKPRDNGKMAIYAYDRPNGPSAKPFRHFPITGPVPRFANKK